MKIVIKNSLLVSIIAGLLILPMSGFWLFDYIQEQENVLGVQSDVSDEVKIKVVDQINLKLSISSENIQIFYDVIPEEYVFPEFTSYAIGPKDLIDVGYLFELSDNGLSKDLVVTNSMGREDEMIVDIPVLIMRATPF